MAKTLVGSVIAIVSVAPARESGMIWYFWAVSGGISLMTAGSISNWMEVDGGNAVLLAQQRRDFLVLGEARASPESGRVFPRWPSGRPALPGVARGDALLFEKQFADADGHVTRASSLIPFKTSRGRRAPSRGMRDPRPRPGLRPRGRHSTSRWRRRPPAGRASSTVLPWSRLAVPHAGCESSARRPRRRSRRSPNRRPFARQIRVTRHGPYLPSCPVRIADDSDTDTACSVHPPHRPSRPRDTSAPPGCAPPRRPAPARRRRSAPRSTSPLRRLDGPLASPTASRAASGSVADARTVRHCPARTGPCRQRRGRRRSTGRG